MGEIIGRVDSGSDKYHIYIEESGFGGDIWWTGYINSIKLQIPCRTRKDCIERLVKEIKKHVTHLNKDIEFWEEELQKPVPLKPCPFCGGEVELKAVAGGGFDINCKTKGCYLKDGAGWCLDKEELVERFNRRLEK